MPEKRESKQKDEEEKLQLVTSEQLLFLRLNSIEERLVLLDKKIDEKFEEIMKLASVPEEE